MYRAPAAAGSRLVAIALAAALVLGAACVPPRAPTGPAGLLPDRIRVRTAGRIESVPIEQYVLGSALAEVAPVGQPPAVAERIFEVQAVLARTYAAAHLGRHAAEGFDVCDTTHCELYDPQREQTSRFAAVAREAVQRTAGLVLTYRGRPAGVLFDADCGGYTAAADAVWGGPPVPYLTALPDVVAGLTHRSWRVTVPAAQLRAALNADPLTSVGDRLTAVTVASRSASGRAATVALDGVERRLVRGEDLRDVVDRMLGAQAIESTRFSVSRVGADYCFAGTGFGHGVGLCQAGAAARAARGDSLDAILAAYFPGTRLVEARLGRFPGAIGGAGPPGRLLLQFP
jgi:stage II sporulation protein D (peptidoglycan lytic transglycosylase)